MREKIEYFLVLTLLKTTKILPISFTYYLFDKIGLLMFKILKKRRKIAISNLMMIFKDLSQEDANNLVKLNFQSVARTACECLLLFNKKIDVMDLLEDPKKYENQIVEALSENENGIIVFTAHFGNWEILTKFVSKLRYKQLIVAREGNNQLIEKNITTKFRNDDSIEVVYKDGAMNSIIKRLKNHGIVGMLTDIRSGPGMVKMPFLGEDAMTVKTIGSLYIKYKPKIIPLFARRLSNNKYEIVVKEFPKILLTDNKKDNVLNVTKKCNEMYEEIIMQNPEQWFWMHNRWKMD